MTSLPASISANPITKPGIYDVPADVYHADEITPAPALSSSGARLIADKCPAIFWHQRNHPADPTDAKIIGSYGHDYLLEREVWSARHHVLPSDHNGNSKAGRALIAEIEESGKRPIKFEHFEMVRAMVEAVDDDPIARNAFTGGRREISGYWVDERWGIWRRVRFDFLPDNGSVITDYKTCASASPADLDSAITRFRYHMQAAWYMEAAVALGLIEQPAFLFIFQEKTPPYPCVPVVIDPESIGWGNTENWLACEEFARGVHTGIWRGYADGVVERGLARWAKLERERKAERGLFRLSYDAQRPIEALPEAAE